LGQLEVGKISAGVTNVLATLNRILDTPQLTNTLIAAHAALDDIRLTSAELRRQVVPVAESVTNTLEEARVTITQLREGVQDLRDTLAPEAPLHHDLGLALQQLATAAQSVSALADFLNRNPNALISGRQPPERKP
jgi:paraquat-inducible protein B